MGDVLIRKLEACAYSLLVLGGYWSDVLEGFELRFQLSSLFV